MRSALASASAVLLLASAAGAQPPAPPPPTVLSSPAFPDYGALPLKYAPNAHAQTTWAGLSPPLSWTQPPLRTRALVLTMLDLEAAPGGNPDDQLLWMIVNLPASTRGLPEGVPRGRTAMLPEGAFQRSFGSNGYVGPQPGADKQAHHYEFELYTLDQALDAPHDVTLSQLKAAMKGHETGERRVLIAACCTASR
jgi:Raf kinase inhibitor-like YbhB/YbcL family protein